MKYNLLISFRICDEVLFIILCAVQKAFKKIKYVRIYKIFIKIYTRIHMKMYGI